jgi:hypothetical protein
MKILMTEITSTTILAGADFGRQVLGKLILLAGHDRGTPKVIFLDF